MSITVEGKEFWQQQLEKLKVSGLSRSQFCRVNGINYDRFGYWLIGKAGINDFHYE